MRVSDGFSMSITWRNPQPVCLHEHWPPRSRQGQWDRQEGTCWGSADLPSSRVPFKNREGRNKNNIYSHLTGSDVFGFNTPGSKSTPTTGLLYIDRYQKWPFWLPRGIPSQKQHKKCCTERRNKTPARPASLTLGPRTFPSLSWLPATATQFQNEGSLSPDRTFWRQRTKDEPGEVPTHQEGLVKDGACRCWTENKLTGRGPGCSPILHRTPMCLAQTRHFLAWDLKVKHFHPLGIICFS